MLKEFAPYIAPALALFFIVRRGFRTRRVKANRLWAYPIVLTVMAGIVLWRSGVPGAEAIAIYAAAIAAGAVLGWFTTQHLELTLDDNGTIMSKPTPFGTLLTAAVFVARFAAEFYMNGGPPRPGPQPPNLHPTAHGLLLWLTNAGLLFAVARLIAQQWHMWIRTRPLLEQHSARQPPSPQA